MAVALSKMFVETSCHLSLAPTVEDVAVALCKDVC